MYLDGGIDPVRAFIETHVVGSFAVADGSVDGAVADYKSALQEMAQALKLPPPRYFIVAEEGPEHSKTFTVEVRIGKDWTGQAQGLSKKAAGQKAAERVLQQLTEWGR
jgi:ribonuclease-3